jgi:hypothetical protein
MSYAEGVSAPGSGPCGAHVGASSARSNAPVGAEIKTEGKLAAAIQRSEARAALTGRPCGTDRAGMEVGDRARGGGCCCRGEQGGDDAGAADHRVAAAMSHAEGVSAPGSGPCGAHVGASGARWRARRTWRSSRQQARRCDPAHRGPCGTDRAGMEAGDRAPRCRGELVHWVGVRTPGARVSPQSAAAALAYQAAAGALARGRLRSRGSRSTVRHRRSDRTRCDASPCYGSGP